MTSHAVNTNRRVKTAISVLLTVSMALGGLPVLAFAEVSNASVEGVLRNESAGGEDTTVTSTPMVGDFVTDAPIWSSGTIGEDDNDELLDDYLQRPVSDAASASPSLSLLSVNSAQAGLEGNDLLAYDSLRTMAAEVAAGTRQSAAFEIPLADLGYDGPWTASELGVESIVSNGSISQEAAEAARARVSFSYVNVVRALLADCPYELYWFDKTVGYSYRGCTCSASWSGGEYRISLSSNPMVFLSVAAEYSATGDAGTYDVGEPVQAVNTAVERAAQIASENAGLPKRDALKAYNDAICAEVSYNSDAVAEGANTPYGNPWQLVWVFDGDPSTNVVCEGYSKAFKYLCDLAWPNDGGFECNLASGTMTGGTGAGAHMWNVVHMDDDRNYLVDVTNCDKGTIGHPYELFLAYGPNGTYDTGYMFSANGRSVGYAYDDLTRTTLGESLLTISDTAYSGSSGPVLTEGWTQFGTCEWKVAGDTLTIRPLGNSSSGTLAETYGTAMAGAGNQSVHHVVIEPGVKAGQSMNGLFRGCDNLESVDCACLDTSATVDMAQVFDGCSSLEEADVSGWDVSNVADMLGMFRDSGIQSVNLTDWNLSSVVNMREMFKGCEGLTTFVAPGKTASQLTTMNQMFAGCTSLSQVQLSSWDVPLLEDFGFAFRSCTSLEALSLAGWVTPSLTNMEVAFAGSTSLATLDLSGWDVSHVTGDFDSGEQHGRNGFFQTFSGCTSLSSVNLSGWQPSSARVMSYMFRDCSALEELDLSGWRPIRVESTQGMFNGCSSLVRVNLSGWELADARRLDFMFGGCSKLSELIAPDLRLGSATDFCAMFTGCESLESLSCADWGVDAAVDTSFMFCNCTSLRSLNLSSWGVANIRKMDRMFYGCRSLEQLDLGGWQVSGVGSMTEMFCGCERLGALDVSGWNTSSTTDLSGMFQRCKSLSSLDLSNWNVASVTDAEYMFDSCLSLRELGLPRWDISGLQNADQMFNLCILLRTVHVPKGAVPFNGSGVATPFVGTGRDYLFESGNDWYYVQALTGVRATGWISASWLTGTFDIDDGDRFIQGNYDYARYYADPRTGVLACGWARIAGERYYFSPQTRRMVTGRQVIDGVAYDFGADGRLMRDESKDLARAEVSVPAQTYTGSALRPAVTVRLGGAVLKQGSDYTVAYENNVGAGTACVVVKGIGDCCGTKRATFPIRPADLSGAQIASSANSLGFTGGTRRPSLRVTLLGRVLREGADYALSWSATSPIAVGTYRVRGVGSGNYSGMTAWASYDVVPKTPAVTGLFASGGTIKCTWASQAQTDGYQLQVCARQDFFGARNVDVRSALTTTRCTPCAAAGRVNYVRLRAYKVVDGKPYYSAWSTVRGIVVPR